MKQSIRICLFFLSSGLLFAQPKAGAAAVTATAPAASKAGDDYVLVAGDTIKLHVVDHADLDKDNIRIPDTYIVSVPYFENFSVKGLTRQQVENLIKENYAENILVHPQVFVDITGYKDRFVYVQGEVKQAIPIPFPIEKGMTLDVAISKAGGLTDVGDAKRVELVRKQPDGSNKSTTYNLKDVRNGGNDIVLEPDDIINVKKIIW